MSGGVLSCHHIGLILKCQVLFEIVFFSQLNVYIFIRNYFQ